MVFTYVYDPIAAGAGTTRDDQLPHMTCVGSFPPIEDTVDLMQTLLPDLTAVGTVYNGSEANSVKAIGVAREVFQQRGIKLEEVTVASTSEHFQAAQVVTFRGVQAMWVTGDNTALQGFDPKPSAGANFEPDHIKSGNLLLVYLRVQPSHRNHFRQAAARAGSRAL